MALVLGSSIFGQACNCCCGVALPPAPDLLEPAMGATDVPLNVRVWLGARFVGDVVLQGAALTMTGPEGAIAGQKSIVSHTDSSDPAIVVFSPAAPLTPGTSYNVMVGTELATTFTTGTTTADTPPGDSRPT
jgi:hypothetical protein